MTLPFFGPCTPEACQFDRTPDAAIVMFEVFVIAAAVVSLLILRRYDRKVFWKFAVVAAGVFLFEFFTHPMWVNAHMGWWAYVYRDISWILTVGWSTIIIVPVTLIDTYLARFGALRRFVLYLVAMTLLGVIAEMAVVNLGLRSYTPESLEVIRGNFIGGTNVPLAALYYIPVFMALCIGFAKYWWAAVDNTPVVPLPRRPWLRTLAVTAIAVFLYEMMVEPMVVNAKFPEWSYVYRDISLVLTGVWVLIIWLSTNVIEKFLIHYGLKVRFIATISLASLFFTPIEAWFIRNSYRLYGPTTQANFSGIEVPFTSVPVEVAFAVPFYLALVLAFVRYWDIMSDNPKH